MNSLQRTLAISIASALLTACGGGGGGGSPGPSIIEVPFTSFNAITANQTVVMDGIAVTASGTQTIISPDGDFTVDSANLNPPGAGTVRLSYDGNRALKTVSINTPQSTATFDRDTSGHTLFCDGPLCFGANATASAIAIDAFAVQWNYQSFGVWAVDTGPTTWAAGAISVGAPTAGNAIPLLGSNVLFTGVAAGFYADPNRTPFFTVAGMNANVNFETQRIGFSTSETTLINMNTAVRSTNTDLNLTGSFEYAQGVNSFSGTVTTRNGQLSGQGSGRFYGPAAQEIGGVYSLQGVGGTMFGGFGGKK
jgi:hypothetical protein